MSTEINFEHDEKNELDNFSGIEDEKTMLFNYELIKSIVSAIDQDFEKFNSKKIKIAGSRIRNNLLNCKKLCDKLRKQILNNIKELPIKHRNLGEKNILEITPEAVIEPIIEPIIEPVIEPEIEPIKKQRKPRKANIKK